MLSASSSTLVIEASRPLIDLTREVLFDISLEARPLSLILFGSKFSAYETAQSLSIVEPENPNFKQLGHVYI